MIFWVIVAVVAVYFVMTYNSLVSIKNLVKPTDQHLFLISAKAPHELTASYRMWAIVHLLMFTMLLLAFIKLA